MRKHEDLDNSLDLRTIKYITKKKILKLITDFSEHKIYL